MTGIDATIENDLKDAQSPRRQSLASQGSRGSFGPFMFLKEANNSANGTYYISDELSLDSMELRAQDAEIASSIRRESFSRAREVVDDEELFQEFKATMNQSGQKINSIVSIHQVLVSYEEAKAKSDYVREKAAKTRQENKPKRRGSAAALKEMLAVALALEEKKNVISSKKSKSANRRRSRNFSQTSNDSSTNIAPRCKDLIYSSSGTHTENPFVIDSGTEILRSSLPDYDTLKRLSMTMASGSKTKQSSMELGITAAQESKLLRDFHSSLPDISFFDLRNELLVPNHPQSVTCSRSSSISTVASSYSLTNSVAMSGGRRKCSIGSTSRPSMGHRSSSINSSIMSSLREESLYSYVDSIEEDESIVSSTQHDHTHTTRTDSHQPFKPSAPSSSTTSAPANTSNDREYAATLQAAEVDQKKLGVTPTFMSLLGLDQLRQELVDTKTKTLHKSDVALSSSMRTEDDEIFFGEFNASAGRDGISTSLNTILSRGSEEQTSKSSSQSHTSTTQSDAKPFDGESSLSDEQMMLGHQFSRRSSITSRSLLDGQSSSHEIDTGRQVRRSSMTPAAA